jgi:Photosynthesis system II assembly factor YCF48
MVTASVVILGSVLVTNRGAFTRHSTSSATPTMETSREKIAELKTPPEVDQIAQTPAIEAYARVRPPVKHMTAKPRASMQFDQSGEVRLATGQSGGRVDEPSAASAYLAKKDVLRVDWGLSSNGEVQRSLNSGRTWEIVAVANNVSFRAISSIGDDVWAGGRAGALYHSANSGRSWSKSELAASDDIVHIDFSDPQNGVLSTENGQVWSTSDGGQSWRLK